MRPYQQLKARHLCVKIIHVRVLIHLNDVELTNWIYAILNNRQNIWPIERNTVYDISE